ncbi:hypothetical protein BD779DRAFT_1555329, partial [Infundibulicybe gibba]
MSIVTVFLLISLEGICGGLAYVKPTTVSTKKDRSERCHDMERTRQEREFRLAPLAFPAPPGFYLPQCSLFRRSWRSAGPKLDEGKCCARGP